MTATGDPRNPTLLAQLFGSDVPGPRALGVAHRLSRSRAPNTVRSTGPYDVVGHALSAGREAYVKYLAGRHAPADLPSASVYARQAQGQLRRVRGKAERPRRTLDGAFATDQASAGPSTTPSNQEAPAGDEPPSARDEIEHYFADMHARSRQIQEAAERGDDTFALSDLGSVKDEMKSEVKGEVKSEVKEEESDLSLTFEGLSDIPNVSDSSFAGYPSVGSVSSESSFPGYPSVEPVSSEPSFPGYPSVSGTQSSLDTSFATAPEYAQSFQSAVSTFTSHLSDHTLDPDHSLSDTIDIQDLPLVPGHTQATEDYHRLQRSLVDINNPERRRSAEASLRRLLDFMQQHRNVNNRMIEGPGWNDRLMDAMLGTVLRGGARAMDAFLGVLTEYGVQQFYGYMGMGQLEAVLSAATTIVSAGLAHSQNTLDPNGWVMGSALPATVRATLHPLVNSAEFRYLQGRLATNVAQATVGRAVNLMVDTLMGTPQLLRRVLNMFGTQLPQTGPNQPILGRIQPAVFQERLERGRSRGFDPGRAREGMRRLRGQDPY